MRYLRTIALALALLILPAAPLGGIVPIPTVGGDAFARTQDTCAMTWLNSASSGSSHPGCTSPSEYNTNPPGDDYGSPAPSAPNDQSVCTAAQAVASLAWSMARGATSPASKKAAIAIAIAADTVAVDACADVGWV